jgi:hypothetical protein
MTWEAVRKRAMRSINAPFNYAFYVQSQRIIRPSLLEVSAKMPKTRKPIREPQKPVDTLSKKRPRGRPETIPREWVTGHAENDRYRLTQVWTQLAGPLLAAETEEQVRAAFETYGQPYAGEFVPRLTSDILEVIRSPQFPKRPKAQIGFLADSLAGRPTVTARTSRDICVKARAKQRAKSPHKILRHEFYIECSCGYRGPARDNACRKCGAEISPSGGWGAFH